MFTGIVEELGEVVAAERLPDAARLTVRGPRVTAEACRGDSIAVNGVCLTVTDSSDKTFTADVMAETLSRTGLGALGPGSPVNLERPVELGGRLGGHLVQGHADGTGEILSRTPGERWDVVRIATPPDLARYIVLKGSITVDGVSLTVSALSGTGGGTDGSTGSGTAAPWFEVSLIPTTLEMTTLGRLQPGSQVNLEVDVIAKYVESLLASGPPGTWAAPPAASAGTASQDGNEQPGARS
ncbi:MAG TPA: riboflavin synthase [Streptosporangiaceae bacterium]|jgi:riboflavin synthase